MLLYWALVFLVVALVAGVLGFGGVAQTFAGVARVLFGVFLALFTLSMLAQLLQPDMPETDSDRHLLHPATAMPQVE